MNDYTLVHYGVLGMKWGVRRTPEQLGHKILKKAKTANLEKWGKDRDHNILYIGGTSGSGKSTIAKSFADDRTDVIHLDTYYDKSLTENSNKEFDEYLKNVGVKRPNAYAPDTPNGVDVFGDFERALESFGKEQYIKGRKVIAEGVQIVYNDLWEDKNYYKDKPIVFPQTNVITSTNRAISRAARAQGVSFIDASGGLENYFKILKKSGMFDRRVKDLESLVDAKLGSDWVKKYLKEMS